ncbi:MAG: ECF transporter S component [Christensenellales bacterium]|jgi:uncharacterized membrane protein
MNNSKQHDKTRRLTGLAIFTAIIVVLTVLCNFVRFGPFSITLALAPIIIGTALYGKGSGAYLGGVFGAVVIITGLLGWDGGMVMYLMGINSVGVIVICLGKGIAAGFLAGLVYEIISKKSKKKAVLISGIVCPVANTGLFIAGMFVFFSSVITSWAQANGQTMLLYLIMGLTGINFLIELAVNIILSSGITSIIKAGKIIK